MNYCIIFQTTTGELNKKQPVLSALSDIISQLTKMAYGNVMSTADEAVKQLGVQLSDLLERMTLRKTYLQVLKFFDRILAVNQLIELFLMRM